ncbi:MAG: imidazole glycerol phosphate synthase subunit HisF [Gemmatimonadetes bacterium]|nr:imidazole glycerol phosphate synthase subunit HisF [Gemmatimonadota bacterium]
MNVRIIPRLDIKGPNLVKGIHLEGLRVLGKPEAFARHYYDQGADELIYMDVVASLYGRNSLVETVRTTAQEIFIPLTVGGGLRTLEDIQTVLRAGADKVAINTEAVRNPAFVAEASSTFGSSTIVVSIAAKRRPDGSYECYTDNGRERTGVDAAEWAVRAVSLGAGELMVTSIDQEGTGRGFGIELTRRISTAVSVPVVACGGAGSVDHVSEVASEGNADAVGIASILHYRVVQQISHEDEASFSEGNLDYIRGRAAQNAIPAAATAAIDIEPASVSEVKERLNRDSISCRPVVKGQSV